MAVCAPQGDLWGVLICAQTAPQELHIGYIIGQAQWGKGLASELILGLCQAARSADIKTLIGGVARDNPASARVLEKAGFQAAPNPNDPASDLFVKAL